MDCSERPITDAIRDNLRGCASDASALLARVGSGPLGTPAERAAAVDDLVYRVQQGAAMTTAAGDPRDLPYLLGSLWGDQLVAEFGWAWVQVVFNRHADTVATAVVSPDRSLAAFPIHFVVECLRDASVDCTLALAFAQIAAGDLDGLTPGGYANALDLVHRTTPREEA